MTLPTPRTCVRRGCAHMGRPVDADVCPECGFRTRASGTVATADVGVGEYPVYAEQRSPWHDLLIVTTNDVPGRRIARVHGEVFGATVQVRDIISNMGASLRGVIGGEVGAYTEMVITCRTLARDRLREQAHSKGANAVVAFRYDSGTIGENMNEFIAYGTAVTLDDGGGAS